MTGIGALCLRHLQLAAEAALLPFFRQVQSTAQTQVRASRMPSRLREGIKKAVRLILLGLALAWFYEWATPRFYPSEGRVGFWHGMLHGALMPMAMPGLLVGKDATIYAANNSGRLYKLGYVFGINICGLIVFGTAFGRPRRASPEVPGVAPPGQ
jgi:hypothetical protein